MKYRKLLPVLVGFATLATNCVGAATLSLDDLQVWAGTGTNRAAMVIEWSAPEILTNTSTLPPVAHKCYAWGYRWDGSATAADMFKSILAADPRLVAMVSDTSSPFVFGMAFDLNNNCLLGLQNDTNVLSYSPLTNANSFTHGLTRGDWDAADEFQSLDVADLYWGGASGPGWELWIEHGSTGGFTNAPERGDNAYWTPDDAANPWTGNHGQWHYADAGISTLDLRDGSWVGWTVAAGGLDYLHPSAACTLAYHYHKHAPPLPESAPAILSPYGVALVESSGPFNSAALYAEPLCVLGEPVTYNLNNDPGAGYNPYHIRIVEPAYNVDVDGNKTIVTLNRKSSDGTYTYGSVTIAFDHPVDDDPANPYGIDFEVFGNAFYVGSGYVSDASDMRTYNLVGGIFAEPMLVSVSPDGEEWYTYTNGPFCDSAFPTQGYQWDAQQHDRTGNGWTKRRMDFTKPVNPSLDSLLGAAGVSTPTADALALYAGSGGGTGFDLAESGFESIQYIRVSAAAGYYAGEVDAVSDVRPAVLGESLCIAPENLLIAPVFSFQEPGNPATNAVQLEFTEVADLALATVSRLQDRSVLAALPGTQLEAVNLRVVEAIETNEIAFNATVLINVAPRYAGGGADLDVLTWDGTNWTRTIFEFDADAKTLRVEGIEASGTFAVVQVTSPRLAIHVADSGFGFHFTPVAGWAHTLERTTDFATWTAVASVIPDDTQPSMLTDSAPPQPRAFYRLRLSRP